MADEALSQAEVESLLTTMEGVVRSAGAAQSSSGPASSRQSAREQVLPYDFRRPERVGKETMQALQSLHEGFSRNFAAELSALLRTTVRVKLAGVDQLTYGEFVFGLENPTCLSVVGAEPFAGRLTLEIKPSLLYPMIDRLLGGGREVGGMVRRPLTEIEQRLVTRITQLFLRELGKAWENVLTLNLSVERVESSPQLAQAVPPFEVVILIGFEVTLGELRSTVSLCIPASIVERIGGKLVAQNWGTAGESAATPESIAHISREIDLSLVDLVVTLAETKISTRDLLELRVGDVITTDKDVRSPLEVAVQDVAKFLASPGALKGHKAIQIESAAQFQSQRPVEPPN